MSSEMRKVTKSNSLIEASYKLTLNEQRLVIAAIAKIDSRKPLPKNGIRITAQEFAESFKDAIDPHYSYQALREAIRDLYERSITKIDGKRRRDTRWLSEKEEYEAGDGYVTVFFSDRLAPYISELKNRFTSYTMKQIAGLCSVYSIRLFEMLMQFEGSGYFVITVDELKERFGITDKYPKWHDLRKRVVDPAVKELRQRGELEIEYTAIKKGRAVQRLEFRFKPVEQMPLNLR